MIFFLQITQLNDSNTFHCAFSNSATYLAAESDRFPDVCKHNSTQHCHCVKPFSCSSSVAQQNDMIFIQDRW